MAQYSSKLIQPFLLLLLILGLVVTFRSYAAQIIPQQTYSFTYKLGNQILNYTCTQNGQTITLSR